jgi:hypothetical protein
MRARADGRLAAWAFLASLTVAPSAGAFPGSVRWGYGNCVTCHFNVGGGGVLTPYGRQLSRELLSTWGDEDEAEFAYGSTALPSWLALGGDVSYLATSEHAFRLMQADLEAAARHGRFLAVASVGRLGDDDDPMGHGWLSRRHYLQVDLTRSLAVRGGRFLPLYGVWNGDASVATRLGLGWDHDTYNVEADWVTERWSAALGAIVADETGDTEQHGITANAGLAFARHRKVWLSFVSRQEEGALRRQAVGLSSVIGIGRHAYLLAQADLQHLRDGTGGQRRDLFANACFARETVKGLYVLLQTELSRRDLASPGRISHSEGAALRWFPRPHFEMQLRWRRQDREAVSPADMDGLTAFVHFYP